MAVTAIAAVPRYGLSLILCCHSCSSNSPLLFSNSPDPQHCAMHHEHKALAPAAPHQHTHGAKGLTNSSWCGDRASTGQQECNCNNRLHCLHHPSDAALLSHLKTPAVTFENPLSQTDTNFDVTAGAMMVKTLPRHQPSIKHHTAASPPPTAPPSPSASSRPAPWVCSALLLCLRCLRCCRLRNKPSRRHASPNLRTQRW